MSYIADYKEGDYEITQYSGGGTIRNRLTDEIVAEYTNYWTEDDTVHPTTQEELDHIKEKLGITITL
mgnify:FL=1